MNSLKFTIAIIGLFLLSSFSYNYYNQSSALEIKGYIFHNETKIENALVKLYQENKIVEKIHTKKSGKFQFLLFSNMDYTIEIEMDNYVTERIKISTKAETEFKGKYLYEFRVDLIKASKFKGVDVSNLDFPTAIIKYDNGLGEYAHDKAYGEEAKAEMKKLKDEARSKK